MSIARTMMETAGKEYNGETIEGAIKATGGSGGGISYDIVIWQDTTNSSAAYELVSGDWEAVKEKNRGWRTHQRYYEIVSRRPRVYPFHVSSSSAI